MEYTKRRNLNRGYMKLEVWQRAMDFFEMSSRLAGGVGLQAEVAVHGCGPIGPGRHR